VKLLTTAIKGLYKSLSVSPRDFNRALWGALSTPRFISLLLNFYPSKGLVLLCYENREFYSFSVVRVSILGG